MARVAVVTPCRDVAPYLGRAMESVLSQTMGDFEYVVVDDGSVDGSLSIAAGYAAYDRRVRVVRHPVSRGLAAARTTGLTETRAPLFALLDGDDAWEPTFLASLCSAIDRHGPRCLAAFAWSRIIDEQGVPTRGRLHARPGPHDMRAMLEGICPPGNGSSLVLRREAIAATGFVEDLQGGDSETWLAMLAHDPAGYFTCVPRELVSYRRRAGSLSTGSQRVRIASLERRLRTYGPRVPGHRAHAAFARYGIELGAAEDPRVQAWIAEARRAPLWRRLATRAGVELELVMLLGGPLVSRLTGAVR